MNTHQLFTGLSAALLVGSVVACSDATSPSSSTSTSTFDTEVTTDLAPSAGEDIATDYAFYSGADATADGGTFTANLVTGPTSGPKLSKDIDGPIMKNVLSVWISSACQFNTSSQYFDCPPVTRNNHTFMVSYGLFDATGVEQSQYDKTTTASINFIVKDTGAVSWSQNSNTFGDTSSRNHVETVSGLQGDPDTVRAWNGAGSGNIVTERTGQITKLYNLTFNDTTSAVRFRTPRGINPYPLSGTIVKDYTVVRTREASDTTTHTATRRVVVTFNGTANVPMTIGNKQFTLNLDTHRVTAQ